VPLEAAVGAFLFAGVLVLVTAAFRPVAALIEAIPTSVAAGMLAGVLVGFVAAIFQHAAASPALVLPLVSVFLVARLVSPAGAVLVALAAGLALTFGLGLAPGVAFEPQWPRLTFIMPRLDLAVLIGLGLPLYLVTMASQNLPGFAVLRAAGYKPPSRSILAVTGLASVLTAPFGAHASNLAAITASICTGPDVHPDPAKRWLAGPVYAAAYLVLAALGAASVTVIAAMPAALVATIAGVALLAPLANALGTALADAKDRIPATLTFAVTASGMTLAGIGSAFWGLVAGVIVLLLQAAADRVVRGRDGREMFKVKQSP
jgi:benzoate membrane transport protein